MPVLAMLPFSLLALFVIWVPFGWLFGIRFWWVLAGFGVAGLALFIRPIQVLVLTPLLRARRPTNEESEVITPLWGQIAQANDLPAGRYVVRVLPTDELNAFACGGHLVLVTSFAVHELTEAQLQGVLAHELSHHLGLHTVAITIGHWLSAPVVLLARVGFFLENVGHAAAGSFGQAVALRSRRSDRWRRSRCTRCRGCSPRHCGAATRCRTWWDTHRSSKPTAEPYGWGSVANSRVLCANCSPMAPDGAPVGWRARLAASHPPARTRVARIEALMRHPAL